MSQVPAPDPILLRELRECVLYLTLNRPQQRNPLSQQMIAELHSAITAANENRDVRAVVITAVGPVFSAGHDLREMARQGEGPGEGPGEESLEVWRARVRAILEACAQMMLAVVHSPKAIIASVEGTATAAGCQLVSACDLAVASDQARFCTPGVNLGGFCTTPLVGIGRNVHRKHAMEMALTGAMFSAEEAQRFGLVNRVVPHDEVAKAARELAETIASKSARGIRAGKEAFYRQIDMPLEAAFRYANEEMLTAMTAPESLEGVRAFLEKRPPRWGGA